MSQKNVGFLTLAVSILVLILSIACCVYAKVSLNPDRFHIKNTINEFQTCLDTINYDCNSTSFSCDDSTNNETVCGVNPDCLCIENSTIGLPLVSQQSTADVATEIIQVVGDLNVAAGVLCIIGILPVLFGAIGTIMGVDVLQKTCGIIGIVMEACFGVVTTLILCGFSYGIALFLKIFSVLTASLNTSNNPSFAELGSSYNKCPEVCKDPLVDLKSTLDNISSGLSVSSNLAMAAVIFSIIALICTCVGFCSRDKDKTTAEVYKPSGGYGSLR